VKLFPRFAVAALLSLLLAGGCARVGTQSTTASGNPWTHHGVLRIVNIQEPDTLDPIVGAEQIDADLAFLWGGFFFDWSDRNEFVPDLATDMPTLRNGGISPDGKTIVYHLRRRVRWHDGAPFGADDVIFTWHAIMNKNNNVPNTVGYDLITAIDKRDDYTVAVHLRHAYAPFVATFFAPSANPYPVLPAHLLAKYPNINQVPFNSRPVGTGPFEVERWQRAARSVFERIRTTGGGIRSSLRYGTPPFPTRIRSLPCCNPTRPISSSTAPRRTTNSFRTFEARTSR